MKDWRAEKRRFFHPEPLNAIAAGETIELDDDASKHAKVLRLKEGDAVEVFDGGGHIAQGEFATRCSVSILSTQSFPRRIATHLLLAPPKGQTLERTLRMATELGVTNVHLLRSERVVGKWDDAHWKRVYPRLIRTLREASRQAERAWVPELHAPSSILNAASALPDVSKVAFTLDAEVPLVDCLSQLETAFAIGPEGGFSTPEWALLSEAGFRHATLGRTVLKVDTATVAALAQIQCARVIKAAK